MGKDVTFRVFRGEPDENGVACGEMVDYTVEMDEGMVVLDVIHEIQAEHAPELSCRWNCKAGKCGSCSAEVNGKSRLMCMTRMEDIMEEIVGEISDEFDPDEPELMHQHNGIIEADARAHIDDLNDQYQLGLPEEAEYDTLNGFLLSRFGRIPQPGESHQWRNVRLTVLEADERQLRRVRLEQLESSVEVAGSD